LTLSLRITAEKIYDITRARGRFARRLRLSMNGEASAARLKQLLAPYRSGPCAVSVEYRNGRARCELALGDDWRVTPDDKLIRSLHEWLRPENVEFLYS